MQIKKVKVSNFKSLKHVSVGSLGKINMIYGYNNTGKSNFLRFLELLFCRKVRTISVKYMEGQTETEERREEILDWWTGEFSHSAFMYTDDRREEPIKFSVLIEVPHTELGDLQERLSTYLAGDHGTAHVQVEGIVQSISYSESEVLLNKVYINKRTVYDSSFGDSLRRYFPSSKDLAGHEDVLTSLLTIFNDCILFLGSDRYFTEELEIERVQGKLHSQNAKNWLFGCFMDSQRYDQFKDFLDFIRAYQNERNTEDVAGRAWRQWPLSTGDVGFARFGKHLEVMLRNEKGRFPLSSYGTGVQQVFYLLAKLFFTPARIVLVEEIELSLSPTAQRELLVNFQRLLVARSLDQLLFTTHSNYFNYREDFCIFEAELDNEGYTRVVKRGATRTGFFRRRLIS